MTEIMHRTRRPEKVYIGIDNGVTGSLGIISTSGALYAEYHKTPTISCLNYQKEVAYITRINVVALRDILEGVHCPFALVERPLVNPSMFKATLSAVRALEATLTVLDFLKIPMRFVDSKEWQKEMLPSGIKGPEELKRASLEVGRRLFPAQAHLFKGDADGILIAEWGRRGGL